MPVTRSSRYRTCSRYVDADGKRVLLTRRENRVAHLGTGVLYVVATDGDTAEILAARHYGFQSEFYWLIAFANNMFDPTEPFKAGTQVAIPDLRTWQRGVM